MSLCAPSGWRTRVFLGLLGGFFCVASWAQSVPKQRPGIHFDVRRFPVLSQQAAAEESAGSKLAAQRRAAALSAMPGGSGAVRLRFNRFGLPKAVVHPEGVVPPGAQGDLLVAARNYLRTHSALFPFSGGDLENLRLAATSRSGGLTFLALTQTANGIPVFGGHVRLVFDQRGAVIQAGVDDVVPQVSADLQPSLSPGDAARRALEFLRVQDLDGELEELPAPGPGRSAFANPAGRSLSPIVAELSVFPMTADSARLAYRVFASADSGAYEILVDATDGRLLYAASLYSHAGQARVWRESPVHGPREIVSMPDTWLAAGTAVTQGNNADVYLDWDGDDRPDASDFGGLSGGRAFSDAAMFDFPAGEGSTGQDPAEFPASAVTNAFYFVNAAHDYFYDLSFTEAAGNFQTNNFGRGGAGNDAVRTHVQDGNVFGSARFLRAPEGLAPILELGIDSQGTFNYSDDRDLALDGDVVIHEYAHGVTARLVGGPDNVRCLAGMQSGGLAEGWSDYFAISFFDEPVVGEYFTNNSERGVRRFAYDRNVLTYEDLGNEGFGVHNDGEIWAATLWEIRQALGAATADELVMNGLRLTPCDPSMIDARDGILDADEAAHGGTHHETLWTIFARRGMGDSASGFDADLLESNVFNAAFDLPPGAGPRNGNPIALSRPSDPASVGQQYIYTIRASDPDGDRLSFELLEGPPGMEVDDAGRVKVTPRSLTPPRARVAITDGKGGRVVHGFSLPVFSVLTAGRSIVIDGLAFQEGYAGFWVSPNTPLVQFTLRGGTGDPDLTVFGPDQTLVESFRLGPDETITLANPVPGPWLVRVLGFEDYSGVRLTASYPKASELAVNGRLNGLQGAMTSETFYQFAVPEGASSFTVSTGNGSGDVDLYVAQGRYPVCQSSILVTTDCDFDRSSIRDGTHEAVTMNDSPGAALAAESGAGAKVRRVRLSGGGPVTVPVVAAGQWFVNLTGFEAYEGVTMTLTIDTEGSVAPSISTGGVVHAASYQPVLAPGGIASLFGKNLAAEAAQAGSLPLPRELAGVRVLVAGVAAPLFYVSPGQINFQTPFETAPGIAGVVVERDGVPSAFIGTPVLGNAPGIFTYPRAPEVSDPVVVHADGSVVSPDNPARPGETVVIYATGVSAVTNPPGTGEASPADPLAVTIADPVVTVENVPAEVVFAGLTPNLVGLLQINVRLPESLPAGGLGLMVRFGDSISQRVRLAVE